MLLIIPWRIGAVRYVDASYPKPESTSVRFADASYSRPQQATVRYADPTYSKPQQASVRYADVSYSRAEPSTVRYADGPQYKQGLASPIQNKSKRRRPKNDSQLRSSYQVSTTRSTAQEPKQQIKDFLFPQTPARASEYKLLRGSGAPRPLQSQQPTLSLTSLNSAASDLFLPDDVKMLYNSSAEIKKDFRNKIDHDCDYV